MKAFLLRTAALFLLWLLLSGESKGLLLGAGLLSALLVAWITRRMDLVDGEGKGLVPGWGVLAYWPWLAWQVVLSNLDVAWRVLHPRLPIHPRVLRIPASQHTDLGRVTFANSITLTPGTVSMDIRGDEIEVHALSQEAEEGLRSGEMDRRVCAMEPKAR